MTATTDTLDDFPAPCLWCGRRFALQSSLFCGRICERDWEAARKVQANPQVASILSGINEVAEVRVMRCAKRRTHYILVVGGFEPRRIDRVASAVSLYRKRSGGRWCFNVVYPEHILCD